MAIKMSDPLKFYLVTDLHHYGEALGTSGPAFDRINHVEQKCLAETGAIIDAAFDKMLSDKDINIVLIAGDLSYFGAMESHLDLLPRLKRLKDGGKQVYLITATHDYHENPMRCDGDKAYPATITDRNKLRDIYFDYGWDRAISEHKDTFSYCVKLSDGYRLLCMNDDGDLLDWHGYTKNQTEWLLSQIDEAKKAGDYIFMMTHHPCLPPSAIYPVFSKKDMLGDYEEMTTLLADSGIKLIFTGHTHMQNIAVKKTEKGSEIYDVNTGSLVGYPSVIRKVIIDDEKADIKSLQIDSFNWDMGGLSVNDYMLRQFRYFLDDIFNSAANDIDHLAELAAGFSMTSKQIYKLKVPIKIVGKTFNKLTVGRAGRLLFVYRKIPESVKKILLKEILIQCITNIYYGDEPFTKTTDEYKAMDALLGRVKGIMGHFNKTKGVVSVIDVVLKSLYDEAPSDWNAILPR